MSKNVWEGKYRFLELGSDEDISYYHEISLDDKMIENPLYEEGSLSDVIDENESSILNDFASGIEINDIDDEASIDNQYLEFSTDLEDFDEDFDLNIDEDIESLLKDI